MAARRNLAAAFGAAVLFAGPAARADDVETLRIELGRRLFYDADLSLNGTMSCATCHEQRHGFSDNNRTHPGALGHPGRRNVPGLANVAFFRHLTWADNSPGGLERQALTPLLGAHPIEMGVAGHEAEVIARFATDDCYKALFAEAYPDSRGPINFAAVARAIARFEGELTALDSPYDQALRQGAPLAEADAEAGRRLFFNRGCSDCHRPPYFTDDDFHRVRTPRAGETDRGLAETTHRDEDDGRFRTAPLRNVALTFPYWHDGWSQTLEDAIALHEVGAARALDARETAELIAFLNSLTDNHLSSDPRLSLPPASCPTQAAP